MVEKVDKDVAIVVLLILGVWIGLVIVGFCFVPVMVDVECSIADWREFEGDVRGTGIVGAIYSDMNDEGKTLVPVGMDCHARLQGSTVVLGDMLNSFGDQLG